MNRRKFIKVMGSSALLFAAGAGGWALTRTPRRALEPWSLAGGPTYSDPRLRALSYAVLAPNPHNRQPWIVDLVGTDRIVLHCDTTRLLPHTDPFNRQIVIGHGCFLELLDIAARELGYDAQMQVMPEGPWDAASETRPIAEIQFKPNAGAVKDPLFRFIVNRRSNKEAYDTTRAVSAQTMQGIAAVAGPGSLFDYTVDESRVSALRDLTLRAVRVEWSTPRTYKESVDLLRIGKSEIETNPDGIDLGGAGMEFLKVLGQLDRDAMLDMNSAGYKNALDGYERPFHTSMGFMWHGSETNTRLDQINAGRTWVRLNLEATRLGLGVQPVSQALQEFEEMKDLHAELRQTLGFTETQTVQMLARVGYGPEVSPAPRWKLESKIRSRA